MKNFTRSDPFNVLYIEPIGYDFSDIRIINFPISLNYDGNKNLNEKFNYPSFMAPEIFDPHIVDDEKSDSWSCGAIIYFLLSGHRPFPGDTDLEI